MENLKDNILLIAGPGSGKTKVLVHKISYVFDKNPNCKIGVLGLTFTSEAAKKMKTDLQELIPMKNLRYSFIGNFHQFGQSILRNYGHLCDISRKFEIIDEDQATEVLKEILTSLGEKTENSRRLFDNISRYRGRVNVPKPEELGDFSSKFVKILERYEETKRAHHYLDFDDLITLLIDLIRNNPPLKEHLQTLYPYIFVDELQDTSLLQLELLKELVDLEKTTIFGVADEDQILYEWRDARVTTIKEFEKAFKVVVKYLVLNYRSPQEILDLANSLISNNSNRHNKELVSMVKDHKGEVDLHVAELPQDEGKFIVQNVRESLIEGNSPNDHVVLVRDGWMLKDLKDVMKNEGLPFTHVGDRTIRQSQLVKFLKAAISAVEGTSDNYKLLRTTFKELKQTTILDSMSFDSLLVSLSKISKLSIPQFPRNLYSEIGLSGDNVDESLQRVMDISINIVQEAVKEGVTNYSELSNLLSLEWNRLEEHVLKSEESIKLMTIHKSKGLEFPIVYVLHMEDGMIPRIRNGTKTNYDEERRILFVAITRSMKKLVFSYSELRDGKFGVFPSVRSRFLDEIMNDTVSQI